ncbi:hypothetical protein Scep_021906 [Stephania cephalantha]|uniref:Uncharacterized protein n=1 Tax=Stephania cephalantha TaxID=152367 RepID=A0AAP0F9V3_9MAGN
MKKLHEGTPLCDRNAGEIRSAATEVVHWKLEPAFPVQVEDFCCRLSVRRNVEDNCELQKDSQLATLQGRAQDNICFGKDWAT